MDFEAIFFSTSVHIFSGILMGTALNLYIAFGKMAVVTTLILPIHDHGRSFHLLVSFLVSYFSLSFHCTGISFPLLNLFQVFSLRLFEWNCFPDLFLGISVTVHRKAADFVSRSFAEYAYQLYENSSC